MGITTDEPFDLTEAMTLLAATPATLSALLGGLPDDWLEFKEDPDAWSAHQVLVHYIHNERTNWIPRARVILAQGADRKFPPFHQLPEEGEFQDAPMGELLNQFAVLRRQNLAVLKSFNIGARDLTRRGEHPVLGEVNLQQLLSAWVAHDLNHLGQIVQSLAKRYREAVGPWRRNLAILDR